MPDTVTEVNVVGCVVGRDLLLLSSPLRGLNGVLRTAPESSGRGLFAGVQDPLDCAFEGEDALLIAFKFQLWRKQSSSSSSTSGLMEVVRQEMLPISLT